jgi:Flp pilus assembly pilin Flp
MIKRVTLGFRTLLVVVTVCPTAFGQAAVEYGLGAARAATTTAPAGALANGIKGVFENLNKTIESDRGSGGSGSAAPGSLLLTPRPTLRSKPSITPAGKKTTSASATVAASRPGHGYEDPKGIQTGIGYDDMVRRFGPPSMSITTESGTSALSYSTRNNMVQVEVEDGKVISVVGAQSE